MRGRWTTARSPALGAVKAVVTIIEFSDFECGFCRDVQPVLKQILGSYGKHVRLVFKHLPLEGHRNAVPAARAAYCAGEQDRFWQFHDALFAAGNLSPNVFERIGEPPWLGNGAVQGVPGFRAVARGGRQRHGNRAALSHRQYAELSGERQTVQRRAQFCGISKSDRARIKPKHPHETREILMKRINWIFVLLPSAAASRARPRAEQLIRQTYAKLETYNAAAQVPQNESTAEAVFELTANLRFELSDFRSGNIKEILNQPYAGLITLPTGDVISLRAAVTCLIVDRRKLRLAQRGSAVNMRRCSIHNGPLPTRFISSPQSITTSRATLRIRSRSGSRTIANVSRARAVSRKTRHRRNRRAGVLGCGGQRSLTRVAGETAAVQNTKCEGGIVPVEAALTVDDSGEESVADSGEEPVADDSTGDSVVSEGELIRFDTAKRMVQR